MAVALDPNERPPSLRLRSRRVYDELTIFRGRQAGEVGGADAWATIARPTFARVFIVSGGETWRSILDAFEEDIHMALILFSFCSRQRIGWYEIALKVQREDPKRSERAVCRQAIALDGRRKEDQPLLDFEQLEGAALESLAERLMSLVDPLPVHRAMVLTVASRESGHVEDDLVLCHAALESLLGVLEGQQGLFPSLGLAPRHVVKEGLRFVKAYAKEHAIPGPARALLRAKCNELGRPPIADVIRHHASRLGARVDDLWPTGYPFDQGLADALQIRNAFVHGKGIANPQAAVFNATRLRTLTERLILALLGWDLSRVGRFSQEALKFANFYRAE